MLDIVTVLQIPDVEVGDCSSVRQFASVLVRHSGQSIVVTPVSETILSCKGMFFGNASSLTTIVNDETVPVLITVGGRDIRTPSPLNVSEVGCFALGLSGHCLH